MKYAIIGALDGLATAFILVYFTNPILGGIIAGVYIISRGYYLFGRNR